MNTRSSSHRPSVGLRAAAAATAVITLTTGLAACSNSRTATKPGAQQSVTTDEFSAAKIDWKQFKGTTITLGALQHPWFKAIQPKIPEFERLTGIKVKTDVLGEDQYVQKIAVTLSSGSATPDVFMVDQFGQATGSGWLEPLDSYLNNPKLTDPSWYEVKDFFDGASSFSQADGKSMAMPITAEAQVLFARTDLVPTVPVTLDQLTTAAAAATKGSVAGFGSRAIAVASQTPWPYGGFAFTDGGEFLDAGGKPVLNSQQNIKALQTYAELLRKYGPKGVSGWGWLENQQAMQQGRLAMWADSSTFIGDLRDPAKSKVADKIEAYPFPSRDGKSVPNVWYWTVGINAKSQHKDAAWLFLQWATSKPISRMAAGIGASPARISAWKSPEAAKAAGTDSAARILAALENADSAPMAQAWQNTHWAEIADPLARAINSAVVGQDAAAVLNEAQRKALAVG